MTTFEGFVDLLAHGLIASGRDIQGLRRALSETVRLLRELGSSVTEGRSEVDRAIDELEREFENRVRWAIEGGVKSEGAPPLQKN